MMTGPRAPAARSVELAVMLAALAAPLTAQGVAWMPLPSVGGEEVVRLRARQLLGAGALDGFLLRTASSLGDSLPGDRVPRWALLAPDMHAVWNSAIPHTLNDGVMWAGRGLTARLRLGLRAEWGPFFLIAAPELWGTQNGWYEMPHSATVLPRAPERHPLSSPWHQRPSVDVPLRFGVAPLREVWFGQSTLGVRLGAVVAGVSTENEWWGPGIRNAIVLSDHAAGIPRGFVRSARPLRSRLGTFEGSWFVGGLFESHYFDALWQTDRRSISGIALTWRPRFEPDLSLGLARSVYASLRGWDELPLHVLDVFLNRGARATPDSGLVSSREQLLSVFGRWVFPADRFAVHFEWARTELATSVRDFLTSPNHSQAYTLGVEWGAPLRGGRDLLRVQLEGTYLEKSPSYRDRPLASFYTSAAVPQGYTQRGQVIGAAIGPGASSQWLAVDYFAPAWRLGVFGGRIRWDDDALYLFPATFYDNKWCAHDVSLLAGIRAAFAGRLGRVQATVTRGERLNMFFYHVTWCGPTAARIDILDVRNTTLEIRFSPP